MASILSGYFPLLKNRKKTDTTVNHKTNREPSHPLKQSFHVLALTQPSSLRTVTETWRNSRTERWPFRITKHYPRFENLPFYWLFISNRQLCNDCIYLVLFKYFNRVLSSNTWTEMIFKNSKGKLYKLSRYQIWNGR